MTHASRGSKGNPTAVWRALSKASVLIFCLIDHFLPLAELSLCSFCKESIPCLRGVGNIWMRVRLTGIDLQPCGVTPGKFQTPPPLPPTHPMQLGFHPFKISNVSCPGLTLGVPESFKLGALLSVYILPGQGRPYPGFSYQLNVDDS